MLNEEEVENIKKQLMQQISGLPEEQRAPLIKQIEDATPEQIEELITPKSNECLFCEISKGNVSTIKVYENDFVAAFLDITPSVAGQAIIIPKEHFQFIFQLPDNILWEISKAMKVIMPIIVNITKANGMSIHISQGPGAGQRIPHLSINLIPRFDKDNAVFSWQRKEANMDELQKIGKEISAGAAKTLQEEKLKIEKKVREETTVSNPEKAASEKPKTTEFPRRRA